MSITTLLSKIVKHFKVAIGLMASCNYSPAPISTLKSTEIIKVDPGNTARYVIIEIDIHHAKTPNFTFTDLPYDKDKGLMLMKDDGLITDYTTVFKILNGGTVNGIQYSGFNYTDGTGKKINYKYSFAINPNKNHSADLKNETSWEQINEIIAKGHAYMNHSLFHGGSDKLKAIKDAEKNMWTHTHYRMTELVPPGNDEGYVESGLALGYNLISSEFGEPVPDGNNNPGNENMSWGSYIPMTTQNFYKVLISRTNLGDQWNKSELLNAEKFIDYVFNNPNKNRKLIGAAFSHGPFGDTKESAVNFFKLLMYIKNHPLNNDSAWITSSKELMDYVKTKSEVVVVSHEYNADTKRFKIVLDMNNVNPNVIYRNLSLKIKGGRIAAVHIEGANDVTFNPSTGLINIYKTDRSKVVNPNLDILPPQIVSITAKGKIIYITYNQRVAQTKVKGYEILGNKINTLSGNGKVWELYMQNTVTPSQTFFYRMQIGNAVQESQPSLRVCTYAGSSIKIF